MQILVNVSLGENQREWAIIELQGDLESRVHSDINGKFIGDLHYNQQNTPILIIGHHILHGKIVQLDKPFAVIEKVKDAKAMNTSSTFSNENKPRITYKVKTIVYKKLLFKTRPKPIIANVFTCQT